MICGIYRITNKINGKKYIGQSVNIEKRWTNEIASAFNENSTSFDYPLSRAFRKYGIQNFSFEVVQECLLSELNNAEMNWIQKENSFMDGYNQTLGGDSFSSAKSESVKQVFDYLFNSDMTQKQISELCDISEEMVQGINTGRYWHSDFIDYPIRKKIVTVRLCRCCGKEVSNNSEFCSDCYKKKATKIDKTPDEVVQLLYQNNGNFSKVSEMFGVSSTALHRWCKTHNIPSRSSDYKHRDVG